MQRHQIVSVGLATVFFLVLMIWGAILIMSLRGGDEVGASTGTAFIILATIMFGDTILTQYKIASEDDSPIRLYTISRTASAIVGGLFTLAFVFSAILGGYRASMVIRAIAYGFLGLLVVYMSGSYLHFRKLSVAAQLPIGA